VTAVPDQQAVEAQATSWCWTCCWDLLLLNVEQLRYVVVELTIGRFDRLAGGLVGEGPHLPGVEPPGELQCAAVLELFVDGEELLDLGDEVSR